MVPSDYTLYPRIMSPRDFWHIFYQKILAVPKYHGREVGPPHEFTKPKPKSARERQDPRGKRCYPVTSSEVKKAMIVPPLRRVTKYRPSGPKMSPPGFKPSARHLLVFLLTSGPDSYINLRERIFLPSTRYHPQAEKTEFDEDPAVTSVMTQTSFSSTKTLLISYLLL
jgi:hypothetical protein